jgi:hypothetical protein
MRLSGMSGAQALIACLFLFVPFAVSISVTTDMPVYEKGDLITVSGISASAVELTISDGNILLAARELIPDNNIFTFTYLSDYLDPSGDWEVKAVNEENSAVKTIRVDTPPTGAYYLITIFSPSSGIHRRAKDLEINVGITDAGEPVTNARVAAYGALGEKLRLEPVSEGVYSLRYSLPFNAPLEGWNLIVTAKKGRASALRGGESTISLGVAETPILIELIRPGKQFLTLGERTLFLLRPAYFNGRLADESAELSAVINGINLDFNRQDEGLYSAYYTSGAVGDLRIEFSAADSALNRGSRVVTLVVGGWAEFFVRSYWPYMLILAAILAFIIYKAQSGIIYTYRLNSLSKEREKIQLMLKKVQEDYYKNGTIDRAAFDGASANYKRKLAEIDEKMKFYTRKQKNK